MHDQQRGLRRECRGSVRPCPVPWRLRRLLTCSAMVHDAPRIFLTWSEPACPATTSSGSDAESLAREIPELTEVSASARQGTTALRERNLGYSLKQVLRASDSAVPGRRLRGEAGRFARPTRSCCQLRKGGQRSRCRREGDRRTAPVWTCKEAGRLAAELGMTVPMLRVPRTDWLSQAARTRTHPRGMKRSSSVDAA